MLHSDKWKSLDYLRDPSYWVDRDFLDYKNPKVGFRICEKTGYVGYEPRADLEDHYRKSYRKNVQAGNIITCGRKWEYHKHFLAKRLTSRMRVLDFGCAFGYNLNRLRNEYRAEVKGYELTDGFVNFGRNVYGLNIEQQAEPREPANYYDLVILYHVLEHVPNPLLLLKQLRETMKPDGRLYLSVPVWFECLDEPGGSDTADFENLYHIDHIQVFSRNSIRNAISLAGLEIESENDQVYGHTFLLKKGSGKPGPVTYDDPAKIIKILETQKTALETVMQDPEAAAGIYPDFPDAYRYAVMKDGKDFQKMRQILEQGIKTCTLKFKLLNQLGILHMQWDEDMVKQGAGRNYGNSVKFAEECFIKAMELKPGNEQGLFYLGLIEHQYKENHSAAVKHWKRLTEINPSRFAEIHQYIGLAGGKDWQ